MFAKTSLFSAAFAVKRGLIDCEGRHEAQAQGGAAKHLF